MSIKTKDWTAQIDRMPGAASFRTFGTVTVAHSRHYAKTGDDCTARQIL